MSSDRDRLGDGPGQAIVGAGHAARIAAGWQRRFVVEPTRAIEMARLYQALGFETAVEPVLPEDLRAGEADGAMNDRCADCRLITLRWLQVLYTRPAPTPHAG